MTLSIRVSSELTPVASQTDDEVLERRVLTFRERAVMRLATAGYTSCDIGVRLSINPATVETYKQRIQEKLNLAGHT
jgi:DNA-binding NarL/FixJ family response regulator